MNSEFFEIAKIQLQYTRGRIFSIPKCIDELKIKNSYRDIPIYALYMKMRKVPVTKWRKGSDVG